MAIFERNSDGSLTLKSVTRCCAHCDGNSSPGNAAPQPESVPETVSEVPAEPTETPDENPTNEVDNDGT